MAKTRLLAATLDKDSICYQAYILSYVLVFINDMQLLKQIMRILKKNVLY